MRSARLSRGIRLRELARALEVSHSYLSACERGLRVPSDRILKAWSDAIGLSLINALDWRGTLTNGAKAWSRKRGAKLVNLLSALDPTATQTQDIAIFSRRLCDAE